MTYQGITDLIASFVSIPIVLVPWDRFPLCHTSQTWFLVFLGKYHLHWGLLDHVIKRFTLIFLCWAKLSVELEFGKDLWYRSEQVVWICYLLPFDLWTSYLARILFLQKCDGLFWESPSSTRIFNRPQHSFQVWQTFINVSETFIILLNLYAKKEV